MWAVNYNQVLHFYWLAFEALLVPTVWTSNIGRRDPARDYLCRYLP